MLVARLVGPSGQVVGIERDANSIVRARARVAEARLHNVEFVQTDVNQIESEKPFDAAVGRFVGSVSDYLSMTETIWHHYFSFNTERLRFLPNFN